MRPYFFRSRDAVRGKTLQVNERMCDGPLLSFDVHVYFYLYWWIQFSLTAALIIVALLHMTWSVGQRDLSEERLISAE